MGRTTREGKGRRNRSGGVSTAAVKGRSPEDGGRRRRRGGGDRSGVGSGRMRRRRVGAWLSSVETRRVESGARKVAGFAQRDDVAAQVPVSSILINIIELND
jgi:hypothetical protein